MESDPPFENGDGEAFPRTRWTLIGRLREPQASTQAARALEEICTAYWYPLYVYARRFGLNETDAKDAVQDLFERLLDGNRIATADAARGRLRTFLLTALKNSIGQTREKERAAKRGGAEGTLSLDLTDAEGRYLHEPPGRDASPERVFERKWAIELLLAARKHLRDLYVREGKGPIFEVLSPALLDSKEWQGHQRAAVVLGMNEGAVKVALTRLRQRYREALLARVSETVEDDGEVNDEVAYLLGLFGS